MKHQTHDSPLPITRSLALAYAFSFVIALLMAGASAAGLLYQTSVYPTVELRQTFVANDVVNLLIGLPILLGSIWWAWRGKLTGLLFLPGALFYVLYNYLVYVFAMPLSALFLPYLALVTLSTYTMAGLVASLDGDAIKRRLSGVVPERLAGGVLVGFGVLFFLRVVGVIIPALSNGQPIAETELALNATDFMITPAWVIGGLLLWNQRALGYATGLGLLFQASMLFIGLIAFLILQPLMTAAPFVLSDVIVILVMGLVCFIPLGLFLRGVVTRDE